MKLNRKEAILLAHLTNQDLESVIDMLIRKGYTRVRAEELLSDNTIYTLWEKSGKAIKDKFDIKYGEDVYGDVNLS